ncbi:hypothetical protein PQZ66_gp75 [Klebsiella phage vB_KleM_KB2]|uniref:hypothetical protein n=1 Tax=Klebsiella phage vB_KleM_KB2 TaxID=2759197 RepID=UPI00233F7A47|nr:hypothetical protein PQZ66_gp75 [Klebsiella phage vB_KleM_KB2]
MNKYIDNIQTVIRGEKEEGKNVRGFRLCAQAADCESKFATPIPRVFRGKMRC